MIVPTNFGFTALKTMPEVILIDHRRFEDERGFFSEVWHSAFFSKAGIPPFLQENHSRSSPPCFRGFHYQLNPDAQGKLVYCASGAIYDFILDIRQGSPTYGKVAKIDLNSKIGRMVYIPPGFAHGFLAYGKEEANLIYKVTEFYCPESDRSISYKDPKLRMILPANTKVSKKDEEAPFLDDAENNFYY